MEDRYICRYLDMGLLWARKRCLTTRWSCGDLGHVSSSCIIENISEPWSIQISYYIRVYKKSDKFRVLGDQ